jgi:hypothetical protein
MHSALVTSTEDEDEEDEEDEELNEELRALQSPGSADRPRDAAMLGVSKVSLVPSILRRPASLAKAAPQGRGGGVCVCGGGGGPHGQRGPWGLAQMGSAIAAAVVTFCDRSRTADWRIVMVHRECLMDHSARAHPTVAARRATACRRTCLFSAAGQS